MLMKKIISLLAVCLLSCGFMWADEIYGLFSSNNQLLTFYYDKQKSTRGGVYPDEWGKNSYNEARDAVKKVVFSSSMQNARPTSTKQWFNGFDALETIEHIEYLNTSEVTTMYAMFALCRSLQSIDLSHFNTSKVTSMASMFNQCEALTELDLTGFDVAQVTNVEQMFASAKNLTTIYCNVDWSQYTNKGDNPSLFRDCFKLKGGMGCAYHENYVRLNRACPDKPLKRGYFTEKNQEGVENVQGDKVRGTKVIENGVLYLMYNGKKYNVQGIECTK